MTHNKIYIPTVSAEWGRRLDDIGALLDLHPYHLCIDNAEVGRLALELMARWVVDGHAWDNAEEAEDALRDGWLEFAPVSVGDVMWALYRRIMVAA